MTERRKIIVVGGGIAGLACAHRLIELKRERGANLDIVLLEASGRTGGTIETEVRDGFVIEKGPDCFLSEKPFALHLCKRIGLDSELVGTRGAHRKTFVLWKKRLLPLPEGFYLMAPMRIRAFLASPLFSWPGKIRAACELLLPPARLETDESIASFVTRRFGGEILERVAQPMLAGIHSGDPRELSLDAVMPRFKELESHHGSVTRGLMHEASRRKEWRLSRGARYSLFVSFSRGMERFAQSLADRLEPGSLCLRTGLAELCWKAREKKWNLVMENGSTQDADSVCLATPAPAAARILRTNARDLSEAIGRISYESVATLNLAFKREDLRHPLDGFGFVVPRVEQSSLTACSFSSIKFEHRAPEGLVLIRAFIGGAFGRHIFEMEDEMVKQTVRAELTALLGISAPALFISLSRYAHSMPQYKVGHLALVSNIRSLIKKQPGLFLAGSAYRGSGISDCVRDAEIQAEQMFRNFFGEKMEPKNESAGALS